MNPSQEHKRVISIDKTITETFRFIMVHLPFSLYFCSFLPAAQQKHGYANGGKYCRQYNDKRCRHNVQARPLRGLRGLRFEKCKGQLALRQTRQGQRMPTVRLCKAINAASSHVIGHIYHNFQFPELCPGFCRRKQTGIRIEARCIARINGGIQRRCHCVFQCLPRLQCEGVLISSHQ